MQLDPVDLLTFVRVVETGSFAGAARVVGLPRSSVTRRIANLEDTVGRQLLRRTTRSLSLTPEGERVFARASTLMADWLEVERELVGQSDEPTGLVRFTAPAELGDLLIPQAIAPFLARWPAVRVEASFVNRVVDLVAEGYDLALRGGRLPDSSLIARRVVGSASRLYASPAFVAQHDLPSRPSALGHIPGVLLATRPSGGAPVWYGPGGETDELRLAIRLIVGSYQDAALAARAGVGIAALPRFYGATAVARGDLVPVLPTWQGEQGGLFLVTLSNRQPRPAVRALADTLTSVFASLVSHDDEHTSVMHR